MKKQIISAICAVGMLATVSAGFSAVSAAATSYVLTNNTGTADDMDIGLTYTYGSDSDSDFESNDNSHTKLTSGNITSSTGDHTIWGWWQGGRAASVIADTHTSSTYITGADLYRWENDDTNGTVSVCISMDGTSYSEATNATISAVNGSDGNQIQASNGRKLYKYTVDFAEPVNGQYVKITSTCSSQQVLGEMVIRGYVNDTRSKILTNNLQPGADQNMYPGVANMNIGLTYTMTGSTAGLYDNTKMTSGSIRDTSGTCSIHCAWDGDPTVTIIADAKTDVYFTGADLYEFEEANAGVASINISVSADGQTYTDIATVSSGTSISSTESSPVLTKFGKDFAPARGRYLKIVSNKAGRHKQWLGEIVIKGYPAAFSFGGTKFDSATSKFSGVLVNAPEVEAVASKVITAVYDADDRFVAAKTAPVTVDANSSKGFSADLSGVPIRSGYKIKSYAWNSDNQYLTAPAEYTVE